MVAEIPDGNEDCLLALLLTLTPNVHTIRFDLSPRRPYGLLGIVGAIARIKAIASIEAKARDEPVPFLTRLSKVSFDARDTVVELDMSALHAFAHLPSVQEIHAHQISEEEPSWDKAARQFRGYESNVTDIILTSANIYFDSFYHLVSSCKRLQKFVYEPCDLDYYNYEFEPNRIRRVLLDYAKDSLKYLEIHSSGRELSCLGSFKDFRVLSVLDTDWDLLRNHIRPARHMLTDALPASIEEIHLVSRISSNIDISVDALQHLITSETQYLPALKTIYLKHTRLLHVVETELVGTAKKRGITITFNRSVSSDMKLCEEYSEIQWFPDKYNPDYMWRRPLKGYFEYPQRQ